MKMILQKIIATSGYCSRRQADALIRAGRVSVNGQLATIGDQADPLKDVITVQGKILPPPASKIYIKLNKPRDYVCTNRSFPGEKSIFDLINLDERLFAVGRLDKDSCGLVLLTNDGDLTLKLSHPRFQHAKLYEVKIKEKITNPEWVLAKFQKGVDIGEDDGIVRVKSIKYLQNGLFVITLSEGKKRQIRRMFKALDLQVTDLRRVNLAGLELGNLAEGRWAYLAPEEISQLKNNP
jgi:pseudouridine synthase